MASFEDLYSGAKALILSHMTESISDHSLSRKKLGMYSSSFTYEKVYTRTAF